MSAARKYFIDVFAEIVSEVRADYDSANNLAPYFIYGHPVEIASRLSLKDKSAVDKFRKFPLIALLTDLKQTFGDNHATQYTVDSVKVLIVTNTKPNYISEQRTTQTFKPILYPIYELLIAKIIEHPAIITESSLLEHEKIDRYAWGSESVYGNDGLIFNNYLDAIELTIKDISVFADVVNCKPMSI